MTESHRVRQTLDGKPAGTISIFCPNCKGETFKLLGPAPPGLRHGDQLPKGTHGMTCAECATCGEQFNFQGMAR